MQNKTNHKTKKTKRKENKQTRNKKKQIAKQKQKRPFKLLGCDASKNNEVGIFVSGNWSRYVFLTLWNGLKNREHCWSVFNGKASEIIFIPSYAIVS